LAQNHLHFLLVKAPHIIGVLINLFAVKPLAILRKLFFVAFQHSQSWLPAFSGQWVCS